jgi:hypothetical protein
MTLDSERFIDVRGSLLWMQCLATERRSGGRTSANASLTRDTYIQGLARVRRLRSDIPLHLQISPRWNWHETCGYRNITATYRHAARQGSARRSPDAAITIPHRRLEWAWSLDTFNSRSVRQRCGGTTTNFYITASARSACSKGRPDAGTTPGCGA